MPRVLHHVNTRIPTFMGESGNPAEQRRTSFSCSAETDRNYRISAASDPDSIRKMGGKSGKGGGRPPKGPPAPSVLGTNGGQISSSPPPRSETNKTSGGKRKRQSPTGVTPEGKADRRGLFPSCAAVSETAGSPSGSGVPRPAIRGSRSPSSLGSVLPSPGGSPPVSEPGWRPPSL